MRLYANRLLADAETVKFNDVQLAASMYAAGKSAETEALRLENRGEVSFVKRNFELRFGLHAEDESQARYEFPA